MTKKDKINEVGPKGHLTSIITSDENKIASDPLSMEIRTIREEIMHLDKTDVEKLEMLLEKFDSMLDENCERVKNNYKIHGCTDIDVQSAIGYFIPNFKESDALLKGAEPSVIVTARDLTEDGLNKFLLAAGAVGEHYSQDVEILKFPTSEASFDRYVSRKAKESNETKLIGNVTDDNIIPTFEIIVNIPELISNGLRAGLSENYLNNIVLYASMIVELAKQQYAASTWPTKGSEFSTIFIKGWDGAGRSYEAWYRGLKKILNKFSEKDSRSLGGSAGMGGRESTSRDRSSLPGFHAVNELLIIPQSTIETPSCGNLTYADLRNEKERRKIVQKLLDIL